MNTKNLPLVIGIALPLVFIIIISAILFIPSFFVKPKHDFLYSFENDYYSYNEGYKNTFKVEGGKIVLSPLPPRTEVIYNANGERETVERPYKYEIPPLFLYNVDADASHEISFTDAEKLSLEAGPSSPDGYTVNYEYGHDGIFELFGSGNDNNGYFIGKGTAKKKLKGLQDNYNYRYYEGNLKLIGWVK